ncbi:MAG: ferrous iron transport protein A [Dethiobacter sp.]|jgi:Fe2+ transport system protein FeoA|nr:ferrous iron transport protein A [Dethiobacter sp.]MBS3989341.1 ferrous iron transport protein A [Dethiobacter sp.]
MQKIVSLDGCSAGETGKIVALATGNYTILRKLLSMGLVPGVQIRVIRCRPSIVVQVGHSKVALEECLAAQITLVRIDG